LVSLDPITLAALQDSGWYFVDYSHADLFQWGKNEGCHFGSIDTCLNDEGKYFCHPLNSPTNGCHFSGQSKGKCTTNQYLDGCHIYKSTSKDSCNSKTSKTKGKDYLSTSSSCFYSNATSKHLHTKSRKRRSIQQQIEPEGVCYEKRCIDGHLQIKIGSLGWNNCPSETWLEVDDYQGSVWCPKAEDYCQKKKPLHQGYVPAVCSRVSIHFNGLSRLYTRSTFSPQKQFKMKDELIRAMLRIIDNIVTRYGAKTMLPARISKFDELFFSLQSTSRYYFDDSEDGNCSEAMAALQKTVERRSLAIARNNAKTKAKSIKFWNLTEPCPEKPPKKPEKPPKNTAKNATTEKPINSTEQPDETQKPEKVKHRKPVVVSKPKLKTEEMLKKSEFGTGAGSLVAWTIITLVSSVMLSLAVLTVYKSIPPSSVHPHKFEESPTETPPSSISEFLTSSTFPTSSVVMTSFNVQNVTSSQNLGSCFPQKS